MTSPRSPSAAPGPPALALHFDARLVEEGVLRAIDSAPLERRLRFRAERDPLYELRDPEAREERFSELHRRWFARLGLAEGLHRALSERPRLSSGCSRCLVTAAGREEYADLRQPRSGSRAGASGKPILTIYLLTTTLLDPGRLLPFLRRELLHVDDLLDPGFEFEIDSGLPEGAGALAGLIRQRYRLLWETSVDGRLVAEGRLPGEVEEHRRREFLRAFPMLGEEGPSRFDRFFRGPRPGHRELLAFASDPGPARQASLSCPLCSMPCSALHPSPGELEPRILEAIRRDFPAWRPGLGLCPRCAELYAA